MGPALVAAEPADFAIFREALQQSDTLYGYAAQQAGARALSGRGVSYRLQTSRGEWVVRRYRRGGAVARVLGDRYLRLGRPRAWQELAVSEAARAAGVRTPRAVGAVLYSARFFARSDFCTEYVPLSIDLAELAFGGEHPFELKTAAFLEAGRLIRVMSAAGLSHPDLNLKNILIDFESPTPRAWVLDLDRATMGGASATAMWRRLQRSIAKWEQACAKALPPEHRRALAAGFNG